MLSVLLSARQCMYLTLGRSTCQLHQYIHVCQTCPGHSMHATQALLGAGADLLGKTHLDELAYSLNGENTHYGTPVNPACPDRIPGGSSSGSAVATADGTVDIGLGSDTGGSVRVPASYCGLLGIRPTHGRVSLENACALATSYDTCGWFARNAQVLRKVGEVLLEPSSKQDAPLTRWLTAADAFDHSDSETSQAIYQLVQGHHQELTGLLGEPQEVTVASLEGMGSLSDWWQVFRITQVGQTDTVLFVRQTCLPCKEDMQACASCKSHGHIAA
ncbi:TPA: hypothetical protein ACH3X1_008325 [Trebouxia sp. C0004]